jgi:hypothetical protein
MTEAGDMSTLSFRKVLEYNRARKGTRKMNHKKIKRDYWMSPFTHAVVVAGARELQESQSNFIELCVLDKAGEMVRTRQVLKRLVQMDRVPEDVSKAIRAAKLAVLRKWSVEENLRGARAKNVEEVQKAFAALPLTPKEKPRR